MSPKAGIYARVSTKDQQTEQQLIELRRYCKDSGIDNISEYIDEGISAFSQNRPEFIRLKEDIRKRKINKVIVWKLDRLSRSLTELVLTIDYFRANNVDFISYSQREMDTTTSGGRVLFAIFSGIAQLEHDLISERTKLKLNLLKKRGVKLGRPIKVSPDAVSALMGQGLSVRQVADQLKCDRVTVYRLLHKGCSKLPIK